jgi:hypothetical protein
MLFKPDHFFHLDQRFTEPVPTAQQASDFLLPALSALGAPKTCHVVSNDSDLDGRTMSLGEAISVVVDDGLQSGTFLSCIPGVLAYFHDDEHANRFILDRRQP